MSQKRILFFILFTLPIFLQAEENKSRVADYYQQIELIKFELKKDSIKALENLNKIDLTLLNGNDSSFLELTYQKLDLLSNFELQLAIEEAKRLIDFCNTNGFLIQNAKIRNYLVDFYMEISELDSALYQVNEALFILNSENQFDQIGELLLKKGAIYYAIGKYIESIETIFKAVDKFKSTNQDKQLAFAYLQIGSTYLYINYLNKAEEYYEIAGNHFLNLKDTLGFAICQSNLALIAQERGNFAESIKLLSVALNDILKSERKILIAYAYQALGEGYLNINKIDSAKYFVERSFKLNNIIEYIPGISKDFYLLAEIKNRLNQKDSAFYFANEALKLLEKQQDFEIDRDVSALLAKLYEEKGDIKKSNLFLKRKINALDSIKVENDAINQLSLNENRKLKDTEFELQIAQEKEKLQFEKYKYQETLIFFLISLSLIFLIGLTIVLWINRKNEKLNQKLKDELQINQSLLGEIHHRVKNNLQIISSMLSIQSQYLQDEQLKSILFECRARINSMSLIHESLYKNDKRISPFFNEYIKDLLPRLIDTYQIDRNKINLKLDLQELQLSLDESIPCGLIINEIVTNSLKHAFPGEVNGEIYIKMTSDGEKIKLLIEDNGVGLPEDYKTDQQNTNSFGFLLIYTLASQLEAEITIKTDNGLSISLEWIKDFYNKND